MQPSTGRARGRVDMFRCRHYTVEVTPFWQAGPDRAFQAVKLAPAGQWDANTSRAPPEDDFELMRVFERLNLCIFRFYMPFACF